MIEAERDKLNALLSEWRAHVAKMRDEGFVPEPGDPSRLRLQPQPTDWVYGFAYWLIRHSGWKVER
jgi:hypothetical protein